MSQVALGTGPSSALDPTYGAFLVGVIIAAIFQGMLMVQAYHYFDNFPNDRTLNKTIVWTACILDTVHLVLISKAAYTNVVTNWGFMPSLAFAPLELNLHLIFTALSCLVAQLFFLERIWHFSRKNYWITGSLLLLAVVPVVLEAHITKLIVQDTSYAEYARNKDETLVIFILTAVADILIASVACYYLQREKSAFASTRNIVSKALQLVVGSGLATSLIAIISMILYIAVDNSLYFIALHLQLGRTYTNALLLTLNSRQQMRQMIGEAYRTNRSNQVELGIVSNNQRPTMTDPEGIVCIVQQQTHIDGNMQASKGSVQYDNFEKEKKERASFV